jgi:hypothetical protein
MNETALEARLAALRGAAPPRPLDARALAALAANPGCRRRAVLDAAGVDKGALAQRLGRPAPFGQSPFAITRGLAFERRVKAGGGAELVALLRARLGPSAGAEDAPVRSPDLLARDGGPAVRVARTRQALAEAEPGAWTVLDHPLLRLVVAGSPVHLEPDLVVLRPDGRWTVVEIKSFPILDGSADPAKVGAAARQAAVYLLALRETAAELAGVALPESPYAEPEGPAGAPDHRALLVCPKDFTNQPTAALLDLRKPLAVSRRQLSRLTRVEELLAALPPGPAFDLSEGPDGEPVRTDAQLSTSVGGLPAAYAPDCLSGCELAFHCRAEARERGAVEVLGRGVRGELGSLRSVPEALGAARGPVAAPDPATAEAAARLARAAALRAEALGGGAE